MAMAAVMVMMAAVAAYAQYKQGEAQEDAMKAEAEMHEWEGEVKLLQANREAERHRKSVRRLIATQHAKMAASGVDISSGSPLQLFADTAWEGEMDAQDIIYAGKLGKESSGMAANMSRFKGRLAKTGAQWAAIGTLASGTAGALSMSGNSGGGGTTTNSPSGFGSYQSQGHSTGNWH